LLAELGAFVRRPVREAEAAHAQAVRDKDDAGREKTAATLREARETARDILGDGWPKAPNALTGKLKRASPALRNAGVRVECPPGTATERLSRSRRSRPRGGGKDRPNRPHRPTHLTGSMSYPKIQRTVAAFLRTIPLGSGTIQGGKIPQEAGRSRDGRFLKDRPPVRH
jgi:hypothetical protein